MTIRFRAWTCARGRFARSTGLALNEPIDDGGVVKCLPQDRVQVDNRRNGERLAPLAAIP